MMVMASESLEVVMGQLPEFVERVSTHHERVVITCNGSPAAVLMSPEDLESLEETLAILGDPQAMKEIAEGERDLMNGDVVVGRRGRQSTAPFMSDAPYGLVVTRAAARAIAESLPESVAAARHRVYGRPPWLRTPSALV